MNVVDYVILGIVGVSVLFGLYRGFVSTVLNTGGCLASGAAAFWLYPRMAEAIQNNAGLYNLLDTYTDASRRIGDNALSALSGAQLTGENITRIIEKVKLPPPLDAILRTYMENHTLDQQLNGIQATASQYVTQTVLSACINVICFLVCFALAYVLISALVNLLRAVFRFPVLKQLDGLAGGAFGALSGVLICFALFTLVPLIQTVVPLDLVNELMAGSTLAPLFTNGNLVLSIMNGKMM